MEPRRRELGRAVEAAVAEHGQEVLVALDPRGVVACAEDVSLHAVAIAVVPEELRRPHRMAVDMEGAGTHIASASRRRATIASAARARQWLYEAACIP